MSEIYDVVIIGAGPAGMSAAIYASRGGLKTLMVDPAKPGGKLLITAKVENWPGIKFITGEELAKQMFEHSIEFGAKFETDSVVKIIADEDIKTVVCEKNRYSTHNIIIATGTKERKMKIKGEEEFEGKGLSYCSVCDAPFAKGQTVTVVGGGNSALEEALYLADFAEVVNIVHRRDEFRAESHIIEQVKNHPKINLVVNKVPLEIVGDEQGFISGLKIQDTITKEETLLDSYLIFPFIGSDASTAFLQGMNIYADNGYIKTNTEMETSVAGVFSVGDVNDKTLRQIVTATSDGAIAAQEIVRQTKQRNK